jgi:D-serine deaminase-like pyridoxal phosphate-dependent protein
MKTHQSHEVGRWIRESGVERITVSSLRMAEYFAQDGWRDITVAFPVNILETDRINRLASYIQLNLLVESVQAVEELSPRLEFPVAFFLKVDVGYHRTGIAPENIGLIDQILAAAGNSPNLRFAGFLGHAGQTYKARGREEVRSIYRESVAGIAPLTERYAKDHPGIITSIGDTPCCSVMEEFAGVDEIRPGNFVFYDLAQRDIGSNVEDEIAVAMVCPAVAIHPARNEVVIYGGAVHFSKDRSELAGGTEYFGQVVELGAGGWTAFPGEAPYVKSLSQEHGIVTGSPEFVNSVRVGDLIAVLPIHSCLTANLMGCYRTLDGRRIDCLRLNDI